jgi:hypothetical protein
VTVAAVMMIDFSLIIFCDLIGKKQNKKAKVTHEYEPKQPDELALEVGQIIEILKQV